MSHSVPNTGWTLDVSDVVIGPGSPAEIRLAAAKVRIRFDVEQVVELSFTTQCEPGETELHVKAQVLQQAQYKFYRLLETIQADQALHRTLAEKHAQPPRG